MSEVPAQQPKPQQQSAPLSQDKSVGSPSNAKAKGSKTSEGLMQLKRFVLNFLVPLICFVAIIILGLTVLYPTFKSLPTVKAELQAAAALETQLEGKLSSLNKLVDFKSVVSENSMLVDSALVSEAMVPELLTQVTQIAQESGLGITKLTYSFSDSSISASSQKPKEPEVDPLTGEPIEGGGSAPSVSAESVMVSLGAKGSYEQLLAFLRNVENAARIVNVDTYRYVLESESGEYGAGIDVNFVLTSPYLFVQSNAVTDEPLSLDISDPAFVELINKVKALRVYKISAEDLILIPEAEEVPSEEIEGEEPGEEISEEPPAELPTTTPEGEDLSEMEGL